jgi:hypothetical protein
MGNKLLIASSIVLGILILLIGSFVVYLFSSDIIYFSDLSVKNSCGEISEEELSQIGVSVLGRYNSSNDEIIIYEPNIETLKHERCHQVQYEENHLYSCNYKTFKLINEIECYLSEKYSNSFYEKIYGEY